MRVVYLLSSVLCLLSFPVLASDIDQYIEQLKDPDENMRYEAVVALGDLASFEAIAPLKAVLGDRAMLVRHAAAESLVQIGGSEVEKVFRELVNSEGVERRRLGAIGLGLIGCSDGSLDVLLELTRDENWEVRWASLFGLGALGDLRAKDVLEKASYEDSKDEVRKVAQASLSKLGHQIRWYYSLDEVLTMSTGTEQKILVFFQIPSETHCKAFQAQLMQPEAVDLCRKFLCVKINPKAQSEWLERYSVEGIPTLIFLNEEGNVLSRVDGLVDFQDLLSQMRRWTLASTEIEKRVLASQLMDQQDFNGAIPLLEDLVKAGEMNPSISLYLGYSYGKVGQHVKAVEVLEKLLATHRDFEDIDKGLYCLSLSFLGLGKVGDAKKTLNDLKTRFKNKPTGIAAAEILKRINRREMGDPPHNRRAGKRREK